MIVVDANRQWVIVHRDLHDPVVRRYPVPGAWPYQISVGTASECRGQGGIHQLTWYPPQFVPEPPAVTSTRKT